MSQKLPLNKFELIEDSSQFNADFAKSFSEESDEGYFLEVHVQYHKKLHEIYNGLPFLPLKNGNWKSWEACYSYTW